MRLLEQKAEATLKALTKGDEAGLNWSAFQIVGRQPSATLDATGAKAVFRVNTENCRPTPVSPVPTARIASYA